MSDNCQILHIALFKITNFTPAISTETFSAGTLSMRLDQSSRTISASNEKSDSVIHSSAYVLFDKRPHIMYYLVCVFV